LDILITTGTFRNIAQTTIAVGCLDREQRRYRHGNSDTEPSGTEDRCLGYAA
jgi:hypothetical protein